MEGALRAPWDYRKVPVRFSVDNGIQNRAETVRLPPGSRTVHLRAFYGLLRVVYGLSAVVRSHENAGKIGSSLLSTPAPARLVKTLPGPLRIVGHPTGTLRVPHGNGKNCCKTLVSWIQNDSFPDWNDIQSFRPKLQLWHYQSNLSVDSSSVLVQVQVHLLAINSAYI